MIGVNLYYNAPGTERLDAVCVPFFNNPVENEFIKDKSQRRLIHFSPHVKVRRDLPYVACYGFMSLDKVGQLRLW